MKTINYITKDCFESEEVYKEYLQLVKEEKLKKNKTISNNPLDMAIKRKFR